jgi:hypothetical protein
MNKTRALEIPKTQRINRRTMLSFFFGFGSGFIVGGLNGVGMAELGSGEGQLGKVLKGKITLPEKEQYIEFVEGLGVASAIGAAGITAQAPYPRRQKNIVFCSFLAGAGLGNDLGFQHAQTTETPKQR